MTMELCLNCSAVGGVMTVKGWPIAIADGSLESRLYLSGADSQDSGQYSCLMPGMEAVTPANINISITSGINTQHYLQLNSKLDEFSKFG